MRRLALALIPLLLVACSREPAAPAGPGNPQFDFTNNPDVGNFKVYRGQTGWVVCWSDDSNGLRACHATAPLGNWDEPDCGLQSPSGPVDWQEVVVGDAPRVIANLIGPVWITVRDLNSAGDCFDAALVAEGWGRTHYTDNDEYGSLVHNTNAWGFSGEGQLTTPAGATVQYHGQFRFTYSPDNGLRVLSQQVAVN